MISEALDVVRLATEVTQKVGMDNLTVMGATRVSYTNSWFISFLKETVSGQGHGIIIQIRDEPALTLGGMKTLIRHEIQAKHREFEK